jgi:hypothetical protein
MTDNVITALAKVIADLPAIGKDGRNKDQGYSFRGIEQITKELQPILAKHGVFFVPRVLSWEERELTINNKPWSDQRLLVEYDVFGPGGADDKITVGPVAGIGRDNSDKGANKAMSQAFKYALLQTLCIADGKDDGDQHTHVADEGSTRNAPRSEATEHLTDAQITQVKAWFELDPNNVKTFAAKFQTKQPVKVGQDRWLEVEQLISGGGASTRSTSGEGESSADSAAKDSPAPAPDYSNEEPF